MSIRQRTDDGASAVEYGLLVAGIAALIAAVVFIFGGMINDIFGSTCDSVDNQASTNNISASVDCS